MTKFFMESKIGVIELFNRKFVREIVDILI